MGERQLFPDAAVVMAVEAVDVARRLLPPRLARWTERRGRRREQLRQVKELRRKIRVRKTTSPAGQSRTREREWGGGRERLRNGYQVMLILLPRCPHCSLSLNSPIVVVHTPFYGYSFLSFSLFFLSLSLSAGGCHYQEKSRAFSRTLQTALHEGDPLPSHDHMTQ